MVLKLEDKNIHGFRRTAGCNSSSRRQSQVLPLLCWSFKTLTRWKISYQSWLLMASPYPGVSTTVRRSFTPRSSISTVDASIWTVRSIFSVRRKTSTLNQRVQPTWDTELSYIKKQLPAGSLGACLFYLLLQGWFSQGKGQWGKGCWSGWTFQVRIHLLTAGGNETINMRPVLAEKLNIETHRHTPMCYKLWSVQTSSHTGVLLQIIGQRGSAVKKTPAAWRTTGHTPTGSARRSDFSRTTDQMADRPALEAEDWVTVLESVSSIQGKQRTCSWSPA